MKCTKIMLSGLVAFAATANAMPTQEQTKKVEPLVMDLMREDQAALKSGKKTRVEVAESAMELADKAESEAAKLLLMKGAFNLYVRAGEFDKAIETLQAMQTAIPDMPPANMVNIIEAALRVVSRKNGGQLYRLLDETKTRMRYTNEAASLEKSVKRSPTDRTLRTRLAEHYAYLGKWDMALENFAATDGKVGAIAKSEREGKAATEKVADFWWNYPTGKADELVKCFRTHAAKLYEDAIASGDIKGLNKVQAERRIEEAKGYGEMPSQECDMFSSKVAKLRLASGVELELIKCPAGEFTMGYECWKRFGAALNRESRKTHQVKLTKDYMLGKFPVTYAQWHAVMGQGKKPPKELMNTPVGNISVQEMEVFCERLTARFRGTLGRKVFRLPTEAEWEYASKGGKNLDGLLGKDHGPGDQSDYGAVFRTLGYSGKDHAIISNSGDPFCMWKALPVGKFEPNEWGFKDFIGNVREVTADTALDQNIPGDWTGGWRKSGEYLHPWNGVQQHYFDIEIDPLRHGQRHVVRGGVSHDGWNGPSEKLTVDRNCKLPSLGFRVCIGEKLGDWNNGTASKPTGSKENDFKDSQKYCVIDISKGSKAGKYSVTYMSEAPKGGWSQNDKTKRIVLRKVKAGNDPLGRYSISKDFYVAIFETTQKQWELVMGKNPVETKADKLPVTMVSYADVCGNDGFAKVLSEKATIGIFDLPTEAQWEYASRAGVATRYSIGDSEMDLDKTCWYQKNSGSRQMEVGLKQPNAWGLYDMQGNVWERCKDFGSSMRGADPVGNVSGAQSANCGGQTLDPAGCCWHGGRAGSNLANAWCDRGFRIVLNLK